MASCRVALALMLVGCTETRAPLSDEAGDQASTPTVDVAGLWEGDAFCGTSRYSIDLALEQDGARVTGTGAMDWLFWQFVADVDAVAGEDTVAGWFVSDQVELQFEAEVQETVMTGEIFVQGALCAAPVVFSVYRDEEEG